MSLETSEQRTVAASPSAERRPELVRGLDVWHAISIVAGTIIGSGIFLVPEEMMQAVGAAGVVYLWLVLWGLLFFFLGPPSPRLGSVRFLSLGRSPMRSWARCVLILAESTCMCAMLTARCGAFCMGGRGF